MMLYSVFKGLWVTINIIIDLSYYCNFGVVPIAYKSHRRED